jgi:hypothetical protein
METTGATGEGAQTPIIVPSMQAPRTVSGPCATCQTDGAWANSSRSSSVVVRAALSSSAIAAGTKEATKSARTRASTRTGALVSSSTVPARTSRVATMWAASTAGTPGKKLIDAVTISNAWTTVISWRNESTVTATQSANPASITGWHTSRQASERASCGTTPGDAAATATALTPPPPARRPGRA